MLAAEASIEDEYEALKAQAVVSRTFALKNLRRHARDGYDLCGSTHCQRYVTVKDEKRTGRVLRTLRRALRETAGEELRERGGRLAEAYFSASCGGVTANLTSLWGVPAPSYLRGARDEHCAVMPNHSWTDTIPAAHLLKALRNDARSDVGARLNHVSVIKRDGQDAPKQSRLKRAPPHVAGLGFKIIVGRTLGWSVLKSSRLK